MQLTKQIRKTLTVDKEQFTSIFRRPENEELNKFFAVRFGASIKKETPEEAETATLQVRAAFYDTLLIGLEDLEIDGTPVTPEQRDLIPACWKSLIIYAAFESVAVSVKN